MSEANNSETFKFEEYYLPASDTAQSGRSLSTFGERTAAIFKVKE
jgi:hypothetical protein